MEREAPRSFYRMKERESQIGKRSSHLNSDKFVPTLERKMGVDNKDSKWEEMLGVRYVIKDNGGEWLEERRGVEERC